MGSFVQAGRRGSPGPFSRTRIDPGDLFSFRIRRFRAPPIRRSGTARWRHAVPSL